MEMILWHDDLRALFAKHCACRPLDVTRFLDDHGQTCATGILADIQLLLLGHAVDSQRLYEAVKRCDRYARGDYDHPDTIH